MRPTTVLVLLTLGSFSATAGDPPQAPAVSQFAPADDVASLVANYTALCEKHLADASQWEVNAPLVKKDGATLVVVALAAGLHDGDTPAKAAAPAIYRAAQKLAAAEDHAAAAAALAEVKAATATTNSGQEALDWNAKHASMGQLMKQVTFVYNRLKRAAKPDRLSRQQAECRQQATLLALIAQAVAADTHEVKDPAQHELWYQLCGDMRDSAAAASAEAAKGDAAAFAKALGKLDESCVKCHQAFRPDQL